MKMESVQRKRVRCPHCDEYISRSLFYQHKQLFFDEDLQKWNQASDLNINTSEDIQPISFEFNPGPDEDTADDQTIRYYDGKHFFMITFSI